MNLEEKPFQYTYSAKEKEEIDNIRKKYQLPTKNDKENKLEKIRNLDTKVTNKATALALISGILGALIMGFGMSIIMTDIGEILEIRYAILTGTLIGILGMILIVSAYPIYNFVIQRERRKIAPLILKLTDELSK